MIYKKINSKIFNKKIDNQKFIYYTIYINVTVHATIKEIKNE